MLKCRLVETEVLSALTYERKCQARRSPSACGSHFSQDDLGAVECRQAGAPCREALGAAARKQVGSCMTVRFGGQSRMGDSSCSWNLQQEPPAAGGSIVISGHFSARTSSQVSEFPGKLQSFPASRKPSGLSGTRFRSSRLSWRPDPLVPAQSAKAGRQGAVQHVSVKTCQSAYAAGLAGPRSRSGS